MREPSLRRLGTQLHSYASLLGSLFLRAYARSERVYQAMVARGYSRGFAAALLAVAGTVALLMPLSIPFLVYAFISGVSMRTLSMPWSTSTVVAASIQRSGVSVARAASGVSVARRRRGATADEEGGCDMAGSWGRAGRMMWPFRDVW